MDASNMLKPALARGELRCVGATTLDEYRKHIEKDAALERRFQPIFVKEPSVEDTIAILRGLKDKYEVHHKVRIKDSALVAAAVLSHRYIADRFLPDKAIDLVDEAASRLRIEIDSMPAELDEIERRIMQLEIERVVARQGDRRAVAGAPRAARSRAGRPEGALDGVQGAVARRERGHRPRRQDHRGHRRGPDGHGRRRAARRSQPRGRAPLRHAAPAPAAAGDGERPPRRGQQGQGRLLKEEVDEEDVAEVVAKWTGIPVTRLLEGEVQKLVQMEERLARRVVGQPEAIHAVANAVRRARSGLSDPNRPIGSLPLPRPDRRRQDGARAGACRVPVRRRAGDGPDRHVGVHGEAHGRAAPRRAAGLRRLRGGRPAHRGRAAAAVLGRALRRGREGAPRRLQRRCSRSSTTAGSPTATAARWTSATRSSS